METEFGTGAVKVTPGHDPTDFEIGERHKLPIIVAMDGEAKMTDDGRAPTPGWTASRRAS